MTARRWCVLFLGLAAIGLVASQLPVAAQGQPDDKLVWKGFDKKEFKDGWYQTLTTKTTQTMKVLNQELKQEQEQTFFIQWVPEDADKDGNWVVRQKIIGVKMKIDIGGNTIAYDSIPENQPANPLSDFFKKLMTLDLKFTIKPDLSVKEISGREDFVKELSKVSPQMQPLLEKILSEKALMAMAEPTWAAFPPKGNIKEKSWERKSELDLGPIGIYNTTFTYTPEAAKKDGDDVIGVKSTLTYKAPTDPKGLPFVIKKGELSSTDGKGTVVFNRKNGRIEKSDMTMNLSGKLTIEVGGMETTVEITQVQTASLVSSNTNPVEELRKAKK